jgi:hypothetical protein
MYVDLFLKVHWTKLKAKCGCISNKHQEPVIAHLNQSSVPEMRASKKLVTGPNGIMVAQTFCDIFFMKKNPSDINI